MIPLLIHNAQIVTPDGTWSHGWILIEESHIAHMGEGIVPTLEDAQIIDGNGKIAVPGFIDVHVHGAVGHDTMNATPNDLVAMAQFFAKHGVTSFLATTMTASQEQTTRALENVRSCVGQIENGATLLG